MTPQTIAEAIANARKLGTPTCLMLADEVEFRQKEYLQLRARIDYLNQKLAESAK